MHGGTGLGIELHLPNRIPRPPGDTLTTEAGARIANPRMAGLLLAETGGSMVEIDKHAGGLSSGFREGRHIEPGAVTPVSGAKARMPPNTARSSHVQSRLRIEHRRGTSLDLGLVRHGTLLSAQASPTRRAAELKVLLGDSSAKVKSGAVVSLLQGQTKESPDAVAFEQGRSRVRVALDLILENNTAVEGGFLSGTVQIHIHPKTKGDVLSLGGGKIRAAGFEVAPGNEHRHIFYQVTAPLADISDGCSGLFTSSVDKEGFGSVGEGEYSVRFSLKLPLVSSGGRPKGVLINRCGAMIRYIVIASMKVVDPSSGKRSIAHFYRDCEIWPALDPVTVLAPAPHPVLARAAKRLFMGGEGTLALTASLHRGTWVASQPVHVRLRIANNTRKTVRSVNLALVRTTTLFRPHAHNGVGFGGDIDACETETSEKRIAEAVLGAGQKGVKGHASAKGWWTGVGPGEAAAVDHCITIPADALTIPRTRLVEVDYALRVSLGVGSIAGNSDAVHVTLPIRVVNFVSLDPPPSGPVMPVSASSMIELDTPRPAYYREDHPVSERSGSRLPGSRQSKHDSTSQRTAGVGLPGAGDALDHVRFGVHAHQAHARRDVPLPALPTAHTLHDLGGVEDTDELDCAFGDIPGSASILEGADSGYSEGGCSDGNGRLDEYDDGYEDEEERGHGDYGDGSGADDVESDEELERMVGCASARLEAGAFRLPAGAARYKLQEQDRGSVRPGVPNAKHAGGVPERQSNLGPSNESARSHVGVGGIHGQHMAKSMSPQRRALFYRALERKDAEQADAGAMQPAGPWNRVIDESPGSVYSIAHSVQAHIEIGSPLRRIPAQRPERRNDSPPMASGRKARGPRPHVSRASTTPGNSERELYSDYSTALLTRAKLNAARSAKAGGGMSPVRARIAMLEQKTREQDDDDDDDPYPSRPGVGSRSMTTSFIPGASYAA
ncbi:hypothetical protein DFH11DRAFT_1610591 [Phellopilus nigrolimitatus]|nr:hypothetical protein DFH11DRAFT_1610591 [Phellopilus nigrolimitatus]